MLQAQQRGETRPPQCCTRKQITFALDIDYKQYFVTDIIVNVRSLRPHPSDGGL